MSRRDHASRRSLRPAIVHALEGRFLLSGVASWALSNLPSPTVPTGDPYGNVVLDAQGNLYGTVSVGGDSNLGAVYKIAKGTNSITLVASFTGNNGANPRAGLAIDSSGNLFGTTSSPGTQDNGTVFEIARGSNTITTLASLPIAPYSDVILDSQGDLFGTTFTSVFEIPKGRSDVVTLAGLAPIDGTPIGTLARDSAGNLFGMTYGFNNQATVGAIFKVTPIGQSLSIITTFAGTTFGYPLSGLAVDSAGNLFGTTYSGGSGFGSIFEIKTGTSAIQTLASFHGADGENPGGVIVDAQGNLYGTTQSSALTGNSIVFMLPKGSGTITTLASIAGVSGAGTSGLILDASGNLYGQTRGGGAGLDGLVFKVGIASKALATIASFGGTGVSPTGTLAIDSNGNVFGETSGSVEGRGGGGFVYEIMKGNNVSTPIATFNGANGFVPVGGLTLDSNGNLYGATERGGANNDGTVFEILKGTNTIVTIATFNGTNGRSPSSGLIFDPAGNLYGTTAVNGSVGGGTVYEIVKGSHTITTLASFGTAGGAGTSGVIRDSAGNLYGATSLNGGYHDGTVFKIDAVTKALSIIATFNGLNGAQPVGPLAIDSKGNLYGATKLGGSNNDGTVFEIPAGAGKVSTLAAFNGGNGQWPLAGVTLDAAGNVFGTTSTGTENTDAADGTFFEIAAGTHTFQTIATFNGENGNWPSSPLVFDSAGNLFGASQLGGLLDRGAVFKLSPVGPSVTGYVLVNADTNKDIMPLTDGMTLDLSKLPTRLNVRAVTSRPANSVVLTLDGKNRLEQQAPWALFGDWNGDFVGGTFMDGSHTLTGIAYAGKSASGIAGGPDVVHFAVINQPFHAGVLDSSFGKNGLTSPISDDAPVKSITTDASGRIWVETATTLIRYLPNGSLDTSFGTNGILQLQAGAGYGVNAESLAIDPSGNLIISGYVVTTGANEVFSALVMRLTSAGKFDPTFGKNGELITTIGGMSDAPAVATLASGKILFAGSGGFGDGNMEVVRLNANGSVDQSFGSGGIAHSAPFYGRSGLVESLVVAPNGQIFAGGYWAAQPYSAGPQIAEFSSTGKAIITFGSASGTDARTLLVQSSGNILCAGSDGRVQRYTPGGSLDTTFANKGTLSTGLIVGQSSFAGQMAIQSDDRILYAGVLNANVILTRYTPNGAVDSTFGTNGRVLLNPGGSGGTLPDEIAIDGQGRALIAAGYPQLWSPNSQFVLARYST